MKKTQGNAVNHRESSRKATKADLKNSGVSRDSVSFHKGDLVEIPSGEDFQIWIDSFVPKGSDEVREYGLIEAYVNDKKFEVTIKSFRRTKDAVDDENLDKVLENEVVRILHSHGDDEQRAMYLEGKTFRVIDVVPLVNRFDETKKVRIPIFEEV